MRQWIYKDILNNSVYFSSRKRQKTEQNWINTNNIIIMTIKQKKTLKGNKQNKNTLPYKRMTSVEAKENEKRTKQKQTNK